MAASAPSFIHLANTYEAFALYEKKRERQRERETKKMYFEQDHCVRKPGPGDEQTKVSVAV